MVWRGGEGGRDDEVVCGEGGFVGVSEKQERLLLHSRLLTSITRHHQHLVTQTG